MSGPTLTVTASQTVKSKPYAFQHPHSAPSHTQPHPSLAAPAAAAAAAISQDQHRRSSNLKTITDLPTFDFEFSSFDFDGIDFDPTLPVTKTLTLSSNEKITIAHNSTNCEGPRPRKEKMGRRKSILGRPQSWVSTAKPAPEIRQPAEEKAPDAEDQAKTEKKPADGLGLLQPPEKTGSFASLARRSWISTSRTPSPAANATEAADYISHETRERSSSTSSNRLKKLSRKRPMSTIEGEGNKSSDSLSKLGSYLGKMKQRPQSTLFKGAIHQDGDSTASSVTSITPASTIAKPSNTASDNTAASSTVDSGDQPSAESQARDPLWSVFKSLESEYAKFQAKRPVDKMKHVRAVLIPFLRSYATHPSNKTLSPEHVEQRANILNKWWNGLLDLFDGPSAGAVPGVDRPALHEVTTLVMMRPEWRMNTPSFRPLVDRDLRQRVKKRRARSDTQSEDSGSPADSDFIAESAEHNVRNMFTKNLVQQMTIVVGKLSQRHMPLSLINFAGKACAFAFFFVPGIADVLVRLWALTPDLLRRVADEFRLPRRSKGESDDIVSLFPPNLENLGWTSVQSMRSTLRQPTKLPLAAAKIAWHGPWISRWRGRETDLFFVFCKYYFILAEEFVPSEIPLLEKGRAPAFVLVNAQILSTLDSTVHRQAAFNAMMYPAADGIDASATALPIAPNNNILKGMIENRLIVLLKDFLSSSSIAFMSARHTFAEAFMALMKAAAKRTSLFDHNACFTLCDFLEESLVAYDGYVDVHRPTLEYIDWPFWFDVCKKIMESNNAGSEIRVLSLIFSIWDAIVSNESRKESICFDWLLKEDIFYKWFNNWCPMVRAYYMRLLCWRICRDAGSANDLDAKIFVTVNSRLKTVWSHYLWQKQEAESNGKVVPSTAPSWPTPGKRFMIIRTEVPAVQPGLMMGFDSFSTPMSPLEPAADPASSQGSTDVPSIENAGYKKKWNIIGKVLSFGGTSGVSDLETVRRETATARRPAPPPKSADTPTPPASDSDSMGSSPTYEALQYIFRFTLQWNMHGIQAPPARPLTRPRLPAPAQSWVTTRLKLRDGGIALPAAGRPAATRAVSGSANTGLIEAAKNANPNGVSPTAPKISTPIEISDSFDLLSPVETRSSDEQPQQAAPVAPTSEPLVLATRPLGIYAQPSTYAGRALAEWSLVVAECNSFVDRRREEGVLGLRDVEVPSLGVEGFRKIG